MKLILLVLVALCAPLGLAGHRLAAILTALHLQAGPSTAGLLMLFYGVTSVFFGMAAGRLVDRIGIRRPLIGSSVLCLAGTLLPYAFSSIASLVVSALAVGTSFLVSGIALSNAAAAIGTPEQRTANFGWFSAATAAGFAGGPLLAGLGIDYLGHQGVFLLLALPAVLSLALVLWLGRHLEVPQSEVRSAGISVLDLLRDRTLRPSLSMVVLLPVSIEFFCFAVPLMGTQYGWSASTIGTILGFSAGTALFLRLMMPVVLRYLGPWTIVSISYFAAGGAFALLPFSTLPPVVMLLAVFMGIGNGLGTPVLLSILYTASPPGRQGELMGLRSALLNGLSGVVPMAAGSLSTLIGLGPILGAAGIGFFLGCRYAWRQRRGS